MTKTGASITCNWSGQICEAYWIQFLPVFWLLISSKNQKTSN